MERREHFISVQDTWDKQTCKNCWGVVEGGGKNVRHREVPSSMSVYEENLETLEGEKDRSLISRQKYTGNALGKKEMEPN